MTGQAATLAGGGRLLSSYRKGFTLAEGATHVAMLADVRRHAFTLAEVLVTLGIIGVVAALTLPSLIAHKKEKEMIVAWKKMYSDISNAALLMSLDEVDLSSEQKIGETFAKYIKVDKVCQANLDIQQGCWKENRPVFIYNGTKLASSLGKVGGGGVCMNTLSGGTICFDSGGRNTIIVCDVNGAALPNRIGVDIFAAIFDGEAYQVRVAQGYSPGWGAADGTFVTLKQGNGTCEGDSHGWGCSAYYILK